MRAAGIPCFGPGAEGAQIEGSKLFSSSSWSAPVSYGGLRLVYRRGFGSRLRARAGAPLVVKATALPRARALSWRPSSSQAEEAVRECFGGTFGDAGNTVVIEEMLLVPSARCWPLPTARPCAPWPPRRTTSVRSRATGPQHRWHGRYSPVPIVTDEELATMVKVMEQTVAELAAEGIDYRGCLYGGFMLTPAGPKVLEFNARFGDPETQVVLPRFKNDLVESHAGLCQLRARPD
ncbi:MAG: hypothetical protein ACLU0O_00810 [Collinsella sp.]